MNCMFVCLLRFYTITPGLLLNFPFLPPDCTFVLSFNNLQIWSILLSHWKWFQYHPLLTAIKMTSEQGLLLLTSLSILHSAHQTLSKAPDLIRSLPLLEILMAYSSLQFFCCHQSLPAMPLWAPEIPSATSTLNLRACSELSLPVSVWACSMCSLTAKL